MQENHPRATINAINGTHDFYRTFSSEFIYTLLRMRPVIIHTRPRAHGLFSNSIHTYTFIGTKYV